MLMGGKGTRVPFCCLLRFWIRLWFWLVARGSPYDILVSVCSKMHLVGYFRVVVCELLPATALWFPWCTCQCGKCPFVALTLCTGNYAARTLATQHSTAQHNTNERRWLVACPKHFDTQLNCELWLFSSHFPPLSCLCCEFSFCDALMQNALTSESVCVCLCVCRCPAAHKYINACARLDCSHNMRIYNYGSWVSSFLPWSCLAPICSGVSHMGVSHKVFPCFCFLFLGLVCKFLNPSLIEARRCPYCIE